MSKHAKRCVKQQKDNQMQLFQHPDNFSLRGILSLLLTLPAGALTEALALAKEEGLIALPPEKRHCTLLHQSTQGLKALSKAHNKALKRCEESPVFWPMAPPQVSWSPTPLLVWDLHPTTGASRRTVRCVVDSQGQKVLRAWVAEFCHFNNLHRDELESRRVFHVSIANLTGLAGDSVR